MSKPHPQVQAMLDAMYASGWVDFSEVGHIEARKQSMNLAQSRELPEALPHVAVTDHIAELDDRNLNVKCYIPENSNHEAALVYYHGGGYVVGSIEQSNNVSQILASKLEIPVISVGYRLAPEHPFPAQINDGYDSLCWLEAHKQELGLNYKNLVVSGDSAGGHLAAMVSLLARDRGGPEIYMQCLFYPWCDTDITRDSYKKYAEGYSLSLTSAIWFYEQYYQGGAVVSFPSFPSHYINLQNLPISYIVAAEFDVLHDEAKEYADRLKQAGNEVYFSTEPGLIHGFLSNFQLPINYQRSLAILADLKKLLLTHD